MRSNQQELRSGTADSAIATNRQSIEHSQAKRLSRFKHAVTALAFVAVNVSCAVAAQAQATDSDLRASSPTAISPAGLPEQLAAPVPQADMPEAPLPAATALVPTLASEPQESSSASAFLTTDLVATEVPTEADRRLSPAFRKAQLDQLESDFESSLAPTKNVGSPYVQLQDCPHDQTHARECRMHWKPMIISSLLFNAFDNGGNLYTGFWYRWETMHGKWWDRTINSAAGWQWDKWKDDNPFVDDYIAHPMMGSITNNIWIQNDPKGMTLEFGNNGPYWRSRLRATAWSTFYSFEWKLGPLGEAGIGHNGDHIILDRGLITTETGWVELVTTPVGGLGWNVAEDYLDKHAIRALEEKSRNPLLLSMYQFLAPSKGFANILRFRPPWYRDSRIVKANSFWSDPGEGLTASTQDAMKHATAYGNDGGTMPGAATVRSAALAPSTWQGPGGRHEFGAWWGMSLMSGHLWGYEGDVKYMPIDLRYSYELYRHNNAWALRYSPELTALAMIDWATPSKAPVATLYNQRKRVYGSGVSPVGFQWGFLPLKTVQPFFSGDGGFIYFMDRVLSPQGSRWMYSVDYGAGINVFRHRNQAWTIGYRYQHLSNGNISLHNPGTDANTFYVGVSRFHNKGE